MSLLIFAIVVLALEAGLIYTVRSLRRNFQWLITEADELPAFDPKVLQKYLDSSFDARLGWTRRPDTTGIEKGKKGNIVFHIDAAGARANPAPGLANRIAAFGDSYVFCRQVEDGETWEAELSRMLGIGAMNFGVGNYGVDQALLRFESMPLPGTIKVAILGFVPETICRVESYWKHYLEFGNILAFKPRFLLSGGNRLELQECAVQGAADFASLREKLPQIQKADRHYQGKFRSLQFRLPYLLSFLRHPLRHGGLIGALVMRSIMAGTGNELSRSGSLPFTLVMARNVRYAHRMYDDPAATALLHAVLLRFSDEARRRGHLPLILVIPQLLDLKAPESGRQRYQRFFMQVAREMPVLDVTDALLGLDPKKLYIDDHYGGHLSPQGNRIVAERIAAWLRESGSEELWRAAGSTADAETI